MITDEKNKVLELKRNWYSSREIGQELKIAYSTINSFLERSDIDDVYFVCPECGKEAVNKRARGRPKKYCCKKCAINHKSRHRPKANHVCKCCGKTYVSDADKRTKFCSHSCYIKYRYETKRIHEANPQV